MEGGEKVTRITQKLANRMAGISQAGARKRASNMVKRAMRNRARRVSNGGDGG